MKAALTKPDRALACPECFGSGEIEFVASDPNSSIPGYVEVGECPTCWDHRRYEEDLPWPARS